ncbi:MAG: peptidylprolyl isomerase [Rikenellaceae bacterium]|nr:peptidylprolyl isomerase [Rikenellaceae bacterium]
MKIGNEMAVAISYTLTVDGQVADQATKETPLMFVYGIGMLLPKFEEYLLGLEAGDKYSFTLSPEEGYGVHQEEMIIAVPKAAFEIEGKIEEGLLTIGNRIPMMTQMGQPIVGVVVEVTDEAVKMDFNHPMAGKTLNFEGEVVDVHEATDDDYPHSCGCGCDDCGCEGDCESGCEGGHCH